MTQPVYDKYNVLQLFAYLPNVQYRLMCSFQDPTLRTLLLPDNGESFFDDADDRQFNVRTARCILLDFWARQLQSAS